MFVDYVRVYQREGVTNTGCNPKSYPTSDYINKYVPDSFSIRIQSDLALLVLSHINAYTNPNLTTWDMANYTFPRNSLYDGC